MKRQVSAFFLAFSVIAVFAACTTKTTSTLSEPTVQPGQAFGLPPGQAPGPMPGYYEPVELAVSSGLIGEIMKSYSGRMFKAGVVPDELVEAILHSGQKAPSAINAQPWHFTVIKSSVIAQPMAPRDYKEGAVVIIISGRTDPRAGVNVAFDCALAAQNMYLAAQSLGLGAHMYYGGVQNINDTRKDSLGIPADYDVQIIMLVGYIDDNTDAVTSASPRRPLTDNVNYIK